MVLSAEHARLFAGRLVLDSGKRAFVLVLAFFSL